MFPTLPSIIDKELEALCLEVSRRSAALGKGIHPQVLAAVSAFMLPVMSYYTNAMEGNPSKLIDIERALHKKFSQDAKTRNYQREHVAHVVTHRHMVERLTTESELDVTSIDFLCWLHHEFYSHLPSELHFAQMVNGERVSFVPGELRHKGSIVGRHVAPEKSEDIKRSLRDFNRDYQPKSLSALQRLVALGASHHRLLWIHPFADGNGRVARLFTEAYAFRIGLSPDHLWTVTRAFARDRAAYDKHLALGDERRDHDYDGRGPLSERNLVIFCRYFLSACLDQIIFMASILELVQLRQRFERFLTIMTGEKKFSKSAALVLHQLIKDGEVVRGDVCDICDVKERRSSQIIAELMQKGFVSSDTAYGALRLSITSEMATVLFPKLT